MKYKCDVCGKKLKYGEIYVVYADCSGGRLNFCLDCCDSDDKKRNRVKWFVLENGKTDIEFSS